MEVVAPGDEPFWLAYVAGDEMAMVAELQSEQDLQLAPLPADPSPQGCFPQAQAGPIASAPPARAASSDVVPVASSSFLISGLIMLLVCICSWRRGCGQGRIKPQCEQRKVVELESLVKHEGEITC